MRRKEERSKQGQTNNKAKQHSTPKTCTCVYNVHIKHVDLIVDTLTTLTHSPHSHTHTLTHSGVLPGTVSSYAPGSASHPDQPHLLPLCQPGSLSAQTTADQPPDSENSVSYMICCWGEENCFWNSEIDINHTFLGGSGSMPSQKYFD